ncbi:MAG: N-acetylmuramoyl-L-alanine amidase [Actinomycetota bacterium]|nr:N-acetylmuramoyl-L-alanine amidase [Actinomycetota bacterium]
MRRLALILPALVLAAATAPTAFGGGPAAVTVVDLRVNGKRQPPSVAEKRFTLAGIHWRGPGRVVFRSRSFDGTWSAWRPAAPEDEDGPDAGSRETRLRAGWRIGNPWWVGPSDRIQVRTTGRVTRVRAHLVWSPENRIPFRTPAATTTPPIVPRLSWAADESIRRAPPAYADQIRFSVVHHTAGQNDYSRAQAPAIVKGIQLYHVQSNGWNDIGYNFLVDRFGTIYEGRFGGVERNVVGTHAQGFNTGSVGVALLGSYGNAAPSEAAQDAIAQLLSWRLDLAHVDPTTALTFVSGGSNRFPSGVPVLLRGVSGHRDTGFTECPGNQLYGRLNSIATAAAQLGLPKIYDPRVESGEGLIRFRAKVSPGQAWAVTVTDAGRLEAARGTGTGATVDWAWDSTLALAGRYTWAIRSGSARPATGTLRIGGATPSLALQELTATPETITPNGDGQGDVAALTYRLTLPANVTVEVVDQSGLTASTVVDRVWTRAGKHTVDIGGASLTDGAYSVLVRAVDQAGLEVEKTVPLLVSRTLGLVSVTPSLFSPNEDGRNDRLEIGFALTTAAEVNIRIVRDGGWVASPHTASYEAGAYVFSWNGIRATGRLRDGSYAAVVEATDALLGQVSTVVPFASDTVAPRVQLLPTRDIRVDVSEPAVLHLTIDGAKRQRVVKRAGAVRIRWEGAARRVRVVARDAAGNQSAPIVRVRKSPPPAQ